MEDQNYKENFISLFPFGEPNQSAVIAKDMVLIKDKNGNVLLSGYAEIRLDLLPKPKIHVYVTNHKKLDSIEKSGLFALYNNFISENLFELVLKSSGKKIEGFIIKSDLFNSNGPSLVFSSRFEPIVCLGDDSTQMQYVIFHLFNFKKILGTRASTELINTTHYRIEHVDLKADDLIVELKSLAESDNNFEKLEKEGGYGLTHIGCLRKNDSSLISGKEVMEILYALHYFLSFAKGSWCNPVCAVGFDSSDRVWELWSSPTEPGFSRSVSWFDEHHSKQIESFFSSFMSHWADKDWNDTFQKTIYWYLAANNSRTDAGIILTQSALERLSYEYFQGKIDAPADSASASYKLRQLFTSLNIPIDLTEKTPELKRFGEKWKWDDAPHALTEIRNYLIHPKNKYYPEKLGPAMHNAWNLGLWYLELSLLKLCGYSEDYFNRVKGEWIGDVEEVPWKK